ncbi:MAG: hypothetical protein WDN09_00065 [bacterium]
MKILHITHNSGFFSCVSKKLEAIAWFFDTYKRLPDAVDGRTQFALYKAHPVDDLIPLYFRERGTAIEYMHPIRFHTDKQFIDYQDLNFADLAPFVQKYFSPSDHVSDIAASLERTYAVRHDETCAVLYRGNDKSIETRIAPYEAFIARAKEIRTRQPNISFLVQTDEREFLEAFQKEFPSSISFQEIPRISKSNSTVHDELPVPERAEFGANFFAAVLVLAKCRYLITHSGNGGLWCVFYRGSMHGVDQWLDNSWHRSRTRKFFIRIRVECRRKMKRLIKNNPGWSVIDSGPSHSR